MSNVNYIYEANKKYIMNNAQKSFISSTLDKKANPSA